MSQARYLAKLASVLSAEGVIPTSKGGTGNTTGAGNSPTISAITYPGNDTAVNTAGGDTVTLTGANFNTGVSVIVNGVPASVVTRVSSSEITFTTSAQAAGSYIIYVVNTDGSTGLAVPGLQYSGVPSWTTAAGSLATVYETAAISNSLSASSDSAVTYSVESGTLPTGVTLFAGSGLVSGTAPVVESSTTYNFTVTASDGENQDTARNFSYTVNPDVVTWSSPSSGATLSGTVGTAYTQSLSATSAAGRAITYTANALPAGLSISGSSIIGTPTANSSISTLLTATAATTQKTATRTFNWNIAAITYTITPASSSVNEGSALTFNVGGTGITNGTYYWSINNSTTAASDFISAQLGSFTITNNVGSFTLYTNPDATTEGAQTFTVSLRTGSVSGPVVATSSTVTINDTSLTPTYTLTPAASSVNEGSSLTFNAGGTGITNGTYYWSINNSTTAAGDFSGSVTSGSFTITNNAGSFTITATADSTTEGAQTFTVSLRTGSVSGTVVATSSTVTINDTSLAIPTPFLLYTAPSTQTGSTTWTAPTTNNTIPTSTTGPYGDTASQLNIDGPYTATRLNAPNNTTWTMDQDWYVDIWVKNMTTSTTNQMVLFTAWDAANPTSHMIMVYDATANGTYLQNSFFRTADPGGLYGFIPSTFAKPELNTWTHYAIQYYHSEKQLGLFRAGSHIITQAVNAGGWSGKAVGWVTPLNWYAGFNMGGNWAFDNFRIGYGRRFTAGASYSTTQSVLYGNTPA
jgi:hypothetical protein